MDIILSIIGISLTKKKKKELSNSATDGIQLVLFQVSKKSIVWLISIPVWWRHSAMFYKKTNLHTDCDIK